MPRLFTPSLLILCLAVVSARPAAAQSLLDGEWMAQATPAAVQARLDQGASPTARASTGMTPLHWAARNKNPAVAALLLDRGADISARTSATPPGSGLPSAGATPLHWAARYNENPAVVALLLDRGADPTLQTKEGMLPVDYAERNPKLKGTDVYWRLHDARF